MIFVSMFVLFANGTCLYIFQKSKSKEETHMKVRMIITSKDVIINLRVLIVSVLENWLSSSTPDLIIGTIVLF
jgi:Co/Zn/Cd efflux system component